MSEYFQIYFIEQVYGKSYIVTQLAYMAAAILMLNDIKLSIKGTLKKAAETAVCAVVMFLLNSVIYMLIGSTSKDWLSLLVFLVCYAVFRSKYRLSTRIVMCSVYYSAAFLNVVISEPWGDFFNRLGYSSYGYLGITAILSILLFFFMAWFLKRFSTESFSYTPKSGVILMVAISALAGISQIAYALLAETLLKGTVAYNVIISLSFWLLELLGYYMFYMISREYVQNMELVAMQRKAEVDHEMYEATKNIYEEMSTIRHEIKNHDMYLKALLEKREYDKLEDFLNNSFSQNAELYQYVNCGNTVVNTIANYEASSARSHGITLKTRIIIPERLPFKDAELCSLLFNLLNNAIEACDAGKFDRPVITLEMEAKGAYLFITVKNPVDDSMSVKERLKLESTKRNKKVHGYGTKVVDMIAQKYHGHVKYKITDSVFTADVMLQMEKEAAIRQKGE